MRKLRKFKCQNCKKEFWSRGKYTRFCSQKCVVQFITPKLRTGKVLECPICKKKFYIRGVFIKRGRKFCSKKCWGQYKKQFIAESNPLFKGENVNKSTGNSRARRWYKKYKKPCEICGNSKSEIHHKDGNPLNNKLNNIKWLCRKCHMAIDGRSEKMKEISRKGLESRWKKQKVEIKIK